MNFDFSDKTKMLINKIKAKKNKKEVEEKGVEMPDEQTRIKKF